MFFCDIVTSVSRIEHHSKLTVACGVCRSILYADIVNFTPLSEQLSASDLVLTLNDMFGRFDQIAQVRRR